MISKYFRTDQLTAKEKKDVVEDAYLYTSNANIKQICKNREFPSTVSVNIKLLSHYILRDSGIKKMLESLSKKEIAALYIIYTIGKIPDVRFFESVYREKPDEYSFYSTFNQRYKGLYKEVTENFIRKGVLLPAYFYNYNAKSKLENTYFYFPDEFVGHLPQIIFSEKQGEKGIVNPDLLRNELIRIIDVNVGSKPGVLKVGAGPFSEAGLKKKLFASKLKKKDGNIKAAHETTFLISIIIDLIGSLEADMWFSPDEIDPVIKVCLFGEDIKLTGADVCEVAYVCGILCKHPGGKKLFQNTKQIYSAKVDIDGYISDVNGKMVLDMYRVPLPVVEVLSRSATFCVQNGDTIIEPSLELMTKNIKKLQASEIYADLCNRLPRFELAGKLYKSLYGKRLVHRNLLVAKVGDLSIRMMLEKKFTDPAELVKLTDDYYAFPVNNRKKIETMLTRSGYIVKEIKG